MRKIMVLLVVILGLTLSALAGATTVVLNFDGQGSGALPSPYFGVLSSPTWYVFNYAYPPYNPSSPPSRIYSDTYGGWFQFPAQVTFQGSWIASADLGQEMWYEGWHSGSKIFESAHLFGAVQQYLNLNWPGVDKIIFSSSVKTSFVLDDLRYDPAPIPLPPSLLLLASGLSIFGFWRRPKNS